MRNLMNTPLRLRRESPLRRVSSELSTIALDVAWSLIELTSLAHLISGLAGRPSKLVGPSDELRRCRSGDPRMLLFTVAIIRRSGFLLDESKHAIDWGVPDAGYQSSVSSFVIVRGLLALGWPSRSQKNRMSSSEESMSENEKWNLPETFAWIQTPR